MWARYVPAGETQLREAKAAQDSLRQQMAQLLRRKSDPPRLQRHRRSPRFLSRRSAGGPAGADPLGALGDGRFRHPGGVGADDGGRNAPAAAADSRGEVGVARGSARGSTGGGGVGGIERGFPRGGDAGVCERAGHVGAGGGAPPGLREPDETSAAVAARGRRARARPLLPIRGIPPLPPLRHRQRVRTCRRRRSPHGETPRISS